MKKLIQLLFGLLLLLLPQFSQAYYDPTTGTWISRDPLGEAGGVNLYAFCNNDPVNNIDPDGLMTLEERAALTYHNQILSKFMHSHGMDPWTIEEVYNKELKSWWGGKHGWTFAMAIPFIGKENTSFPWFGQVEFGLDSKSQLRNQYPWYENDHDVALREAVRTNNAAVTTYLANHGQLNAAGRQQLAIKVYMALFELTTTTASIPFGGIRAPTSAFSVSVGVGSREFSTILSSKSLAVDARLLTRRTHTTWTASLSKINETIYSLGKRAIARNPRKWGNAELLFEKYLDAVDSRLIRLDARYRIELQPAALPGGTRVSPFLRYDDFGFGLERFPGSRRLDAAVVDATTDDVFAPVVSGFDITINPLKKPVVDYYQHAFGLIPIFDIGP